MGQSLMQRSFAAGELAPVLHARADQVKYTAGLRTCRNFLVRREGGVSNRAGFRFVDACKTNTAGTRLMRYLSSTAGESYLIEMGQGYFRFFREGASVEVSGVPAYNGATAYVPGDLVASGGVNYYCHTATTGHAPPDASYWYALTGAIYEIPTPYSLAALPDWNQSGNVITLTHPTYVPRELVCESTTRWILRQVTTAPSIAAPSGLTGHAGAAGKRTYRYRVTAAAQDTYEESNDSGYYQIGSCAEPTEDAPNVLSWSPVAGAAEYYVYLDPYENGTYGFVGTATGATSFKDPGLVPDFEITPPIARSLFQSSGKYPSHSATYQQRRIFANSNNEPDAIWASRIGFRSNFGISSPLQDDDALTFRIAGNNYHPIRHLVALKSGLVLLTDGGEWTVTGGGGPRTPLTPSSLDAAQETYVGVSATVRPAIVGEAILYLQARGSIVRDLRFDQQVEGLAGRDLTIWATHLFERQTIVALDYQQVPHSIIWCVRSDGALLGLTYVPDQDIWGWHRHDTDGAFEDCCVLPEDEEDALYVIVKRTIGGADKRYIERLERREIRDGYVHAESFFVDSGLSYSSAYPASHFSGLNHLEGKVVTVLGDGTVVGTFTVTGGSITTPAAYRNVHVGLPIQYGEIETLDLDVQGSAIRDKKKRIVSVTLLVDRSARGFYAGPDASHLRRYTPEDWDGAADLNTGQLELRVTSQYDQYGRVLVRQVDPLALTILGVIPNVELGG
jgi:hypothetical protein